MTRTLAAVLVLALAGCAEPPPPARTTAAELAPGTINVHMHGELQFLYGVRSSGR
jgi:hypothetical protein